MKVLFCPAAGPRLGFGHLVRSLSLARALDVPAKFAVRGGATARAAATALGARPQQRPALAALRSRPDLVVIDDPSPRHTERLSLAARRLGVTTVRVHDLGLGIGDADLIVDGSVVWLASSKSRKTARRWHGRALLGPRFMILNPRLEEVRRRARRPSRGRPTVLVALGGGPWVLTAAAVGRAIRRHSPDVRVRLASGFCRPGPGRVTRDGFERLAPGRPILRPLAEATLAVVAGGVTLYECCALGVPAIAFPVTPSQRPTIRAFGRLGACVAVDGPRCSPRRMTPERIGTAVAALLAAPAERRRLAARGRRLVDGWGAHRVASAIRELGRARGVERAA